MISACMSFKEDPFRQMWPPDTHLVPVATQITSASSKDVLLVMTIPAKTFRRECWISPLITSMNFSFTILEIISILEECYTRMWTNLPIPSAFNMDSCDMFESELGSFSPFLCGVYMISLAKAIFAAAALAFLLLDPKKHWFLIS